MATREIYQSGFDEDVQLDSSPNQCRESNGRVTTNIGETVCEDCGLVIDELSVEEIMCDDDLARLAFHQVGPYDGPTVFLYNEYANGSCHREQLDRVQEESEELWIVPADVHFSQIPRITYWRRERRTSTLPYRNTETGARDVLHRAPDSSRYKWRAAILVDGYPVRSQGYEKKEMNSFRDELREQPAPILSCPERKNDDGRVGEKSETERRSRAGSTAPTAGRRSVEDRLR